MITTWLVLCPTHINADCTHPTKRLNKESSGDRPLLNALKMDTCHLNNNTKNNMITTTAHASL